MDPFQLKKLNELTDIIESRLSWGSADSWRGGDFERLSDQIFDKTGKRLSVTTLKRIWGRAALESNPSPTTLDILTEFADLGSWRDFSLLEEEGSEPYDKWRKWKILWLVCVIPLMCIALYLMSNRSGSKSSPPINMDQIEFDLKKVSVGYPNTVIFRYDVGSNPYDSLFIQQSWDGSRRLALEDSSGMVTSTYYYPGYYLTKLLINNTVVAEKELYIPTSGWQGMVVKGPDIHYLDDGEISREALLRVSEDVLEEMNDDGADYLYLASLSEEPVINSDQFDFEVDFRLSKALDASICKAMQMIITGTREVLGFKFGLVGCAGDLMFFLNQDMISGKDQDLSAFGIKPGVWTNFRLRNEDNQLTVWIDDAEVFSHQMKSDIGRIGGVQWFFEGLGEVKNLRMTDESGVVNLVETGSGSK